jgi:hypothetical protein
MSTSFVIAGRALASPRARLAAVERAREPERESRSGGPAAGATPTAPAATSFDLGGWSA